MVGVVGTAAVVVSVVVATILAAGAATAEGSVADGGGAMLQVHACLAAAGALRYAFAVHSQQHRVVGLQGGVTAAQTATLML